MPNVTDTVTIDGYTQPGASPNTAATGTNAKLLVELDGTNAGTETSGLSIAAANSVVRGLVINRFEIGIFVTGTATTGVRVVGCFLGTDPTGTLARGRDTGSGGLFINAPSTSIAKSPRSWSKPGLHDVPDIETGW